MSNSYTKLKSGEWGVRVVGPKPREGQSVTVKKKDGTEKRETVEQVVYSAPDGRTHLIAVSRAERPRTAQVGIRGGRRRTGCRCGSYEDEINAGDCFSCRHDQE